MNKHDRGVHSSPALLLVLLVLLVALPGCWYLCEEVNRHAWSACQLMGSSSLVVIFVYLMHILPFKCNSNGVSHLSKHVIASHPCPPSVAPLSLKPPHFCSAARHTA